MAGPENQLCPPAPETELDEEAALALARYYDEGYDGQIPSYAEEALAHYERIRSEDNETG